MPDPDRPRPSSFPPPAPSGVYEGHDLKALVELTASLATQHDIFAILYLVVSRLAELLHVDRGSIVLLDDGGTTATVVASSDDRAVHNLVLHLEKYPELKSVFESGQILVIQDVRRSPIMKEVILAEGPIDFASMALVPITCERGPLAILCLKGRSYVRFTEYDLLEAQAVANATAIALNNARILSALRTEADDRQVKHEQRMQQLEQDVSQERALARELSQTKDFLERLIESSVDLIVAADLKGNILLFNRAAEKVFGYKKEDVIQKSNVEKLYPPGVARQVMAKIRGHSYGGKDRLEDYRVDMISKSGETIPVSLSASVVMNGKTPVGTLGIFTDIREKLRMEASLLAAQRELRQHEKLSAMTELAGAAAHELNQPLTSIMGYAEYLLRVARDDANVLRAARVIQGEADRMADIVRKVGRITHYRTKPYVGDSVIVDLDRASEGPPDELGIPKIAEVPMGSPKTPREYNHAETECPAPEPAATAAPQSSPPADPPSLGEPPGDANS